MTSHGGEQWQSFSPSVNQLSNVLLSPYHCCYESEILYTVYNR